MPACLAVCNLKSIIICDSIHSIPPCATAFTYHKHTAAALSRWKNFFLFLVEIFISHAAIISSTLISSLNSMRKCVSEEEVFTMTIFGVCGFSKFFKRFRHTISLTKAPLFWLFASPSTHSIDNQWNFYFNLRQTLFLKKKKSRWF